MAVTMVVPPLLSVILGKRDGGTTLPMVVTKWCTAVHLAVYTGHASDCPPTCYSWPLLGGHRPRGGGAIRIVAVPAPAPALLCLSQPVNGRARVVHRRTHGGDHPEANSSVSYDFVS